MFTADQLKPMFDLIQALTNSASNEGCSGDLTVVELSALEKLNAESEYLQTLKQSLALGIHTHKHGESVYSYLVPAGTTFDKYVMKKLLVEEFEPDNDEFVSVETLEPTPLLDQLYVAFSEKESESDGEPCFWSNKDGWGHLYSATKFHKSETEDFGLPVTPGNDAKWILYPEAKGRIGND